MLIAEPHSPQDTHTASTDPVTEPTLNPVQSSNVFDEEVADIAQVHCDSELFEFELSTSPPCVNVKGNLRRNFEFWKHIGTPRYVNKFLRKLQVKYEDWKTAMYYFSGGVYMFFLRSEKWVPPR